MAARRSQRSRRTPAGSHEPGMQRLYTHMADNISGGRGAIAAGKQHDRQDGLDAGHDDKTLIPGDQDLGNASQGYAQ